MTCCAASTRSGKGSRCKDVQHAADGQGAFATMFIAVCEAEDVLPSQQG
jgi:hypothetical protein